MSDLMREQFEKRYPVPFNTEWSEKMKRYVWNEKDNSLSAAMEHNKIFDAWQASRECLVIELPKPYAVIGDYADCGGGRTVWDAEFSEKITDRMCKKTAVYDKTIFEALGLKVKP